MIPVGVVRSLVEVGPESPVVELQVRSWMGGRSRPRGSYRWWIAGNAAGALAALASVREGSGRRRWSRIL